MTDRPDRPGAPDRVVRGTPMTPYGELGRVALTAEQHAMRTTVHWRNIPPSDLPSETELDAYPERKYETELSTSSSVIVYSTAAWPRAAERDVVFVFDARTHHPTANGRPVIPVAITGPDGQRLLARGCSKPCPAWPVAIGDRVFIDLTPARAAQIARADVDHVRAVAPDAYERAAERHANEQCLIDCSAEHLLSQGWPDLAHVTSAMAEHLNHPDAIADRTELVDMRPGCRAGDQPAAAPVGPSRTDLVAALSKLLAAIGGGPGAIAEEYGEIAIIFFRGLAVTDASVRQRLDDALAVACEVGNTYDEHGEPISPDAWLVMRNDRERRFLDASSLSNRKGPPAARDYDIQLVLECTGLGMADRVGGPVHDLGFMLLYRFVDADTGVEASPKVMLRSYGRRERDRAIAEVTAMRADPSGAANMIMRHALAYTRFSEQLEGKLSNADLIAAGPRRARHKA